MPYASASASEEPPDGRWLRHGRLVATLLFVGLLVAFVIACVAATNAEAKAHGQPIATPDLVRSTTAARARACSVRLRLCDVRDVLGWTRPGLPPPLPKHRRLSSWLRMRSHYRHLAREYAASIRRGTQRIESRPVLLGRQMAAERGWVGAEWNALYELWRLESGWRVTAANPSSSAYGIPQALPGSKMGAGWRYSARVQIRWGLNYVRARYGRPSNALAHLRAYSWY